MRCLVGLLGCLARDGVVYGVQEDVAMKQQEKLQRKQEVKELAAKEEAAVVSKKKVLY